MSGADRVKREKTERRRIILSCALDQFRELGYEKTTMNSISKRSEYTCRTIYRYFQNKEDLFFAAVLDDYQRLSASIKEKVSDEKTGYAKIEQTMKAYQSFAAEHKYFIPFTIKANELSNNMDTEKAAPYQKKYMELYQEIFHDIAVLFQQGQKDGSIRTDVDAVSLAVSTILEVTGFLNMQELTSERFNSRFGISEKQIIEFTFTRILENLVSTK